MLTYTPTQDRCHGHEQTAKMAAAFDAPLLPTRAPSLRQPRVLVCARDKVDYDDIRLNESCAVISTPISSRQSPQQV